MDRRQFLGAFGATALAAGNIGVAAEATAPAAAAKSVPNTASDDFADLDAVGQAQLFKSGQVSAAELVEASISRIERHNGLFNAVVEPAFNLGRELAKKSKPTDGPFAGVPYLLKCLNSKEGQPATKASRYFRDVVADKSDPVTVDFDKSGAIFIGQSNSPEFGALPSTESSLYGPCNNPWDLGRSSSGSSGGAAAAVAAGLVPLATASDGGGSIRLPASACGLVGLKHSRGREKPKSKDNILTNTGCVSRTVRDTAAVLQMTEQHNNSALPPIGMISGPSSKRLKVALAIKGVRADSKPDAEVEAATLLVARKLESLGHEVSMERFDVNGEEFWHHFLMLWSMLPYSSDQRAQKAQGRPSGEGDFENWSLHLSGLVGTVYDPSVDIDKALAYFQKLERQANAFHSKYDVSLTPVTANVAEKTGSFSPRRADMDALMDAVTYWTGYTPFHNATGLPSISLPLSMSKAGMPIGAMFSAGFGNEATLLHLAYELEEELPWINRRPVYHAFGS
ncbi:putative amidase AmiC [Kordiimonas sediminis]|uniref:Amidase AmiC n=1 Tax=Kordiimonas sediminis TaxID=1735581 RepID=A0A919AP77_9PROT|nr:amidase family protein [Kordiimonas sediminis]GHF18940.1 putative amidase AmiC [Kordiimonas sediminis]